MLISLDRFRHRSQGTICDLEGAPQSRRAEAYLLSNASFFHFVMRTFRNICGAVPAPGMCYVGHYVLAEKFSLEIRAILQEINAFNFAGKFKCSLRERARRTSLQINAG